MSVKSFISSYLKKNMIGDAVIYAACHPEKYIVEDNNSTTIKTSYGATSKNYVLQPLNA